MRVLLGALAAGRARAEARMGETCEVIREEPGAWDEEQGRHATTERQIFAGPCRIKTLTAIPEKVDAGSQLLAKTEPEAHLPIEAVGVAAGDEIRITASLTRPGLAGRRYRVIAPFEGSQTTALRFRVEVAHAR